MKAWTKQKTAVTASVILLLLILWLVPGRLTVAYHEAALKRAITSMPSGTETVTLEEVVPFDWERVYTFSPYTTRAEMEEVIGFQSGTLEESVSEGMVQLVFVKGDKVAAAICGYPQTLGYSVSLKGCVACGDEAVFSVEKQEGITVLRQQ